MADWYIRHNGRIHGPVSKTDMATVVADPRISADTVVRCGEVGLWVKPSEVEGLIASSAKPAAITTAPNNDVADTSPRRGNNGKSTTDQQKRTVAGRVMMVGIFMFLTAVVKLVFLIAGAFDPAPAKPPVAKGKPPVKQVQPTAHQDEWQRNSQGFRIAKSVRSWVGTTPPRAIERNHTLVHVSEAWLQPAVDEASDHQILFVRINIKNTSPDQPLSYLGWNGFDFHPDDDLCAVLIDKNGIAEIVPAEETPEHERHGAVEIPAESAIDDLLVFRVPLDEVESYLLALPYAVLGFDEALGFKIPASTLAGTAGAKKVIKRAPRANGTGDL